MSPPYNLGIRYRTYDDGRLRAEYLEWSDQWIAKVAHALKSKGSLFLNVGAKPTDPWTALDVAQVARRHLALQNIIHWVKSIAIEKEAAGARAHLADDLAVGHYKPINPDRFLNDCHEFVFHFAARANAARPACARRQVSGPVERYEVAARGLRPPVSGKHLVHPVRDDSKPRS